MLSATTEALLAELCATLCRHSWIRNFLLNADPKSDISLLSSPLARRHALSRTRHVSAHEPNSNHAYVLDHRTAASTVHIPAYSLDGVTVGLSVRERTVSKPYHALQPPPHSLSFARFALFDAAALLLEARPAAGATETELVLTSLRTLRRKTRVALLLRGRAAALAAVPPPHLPRHLAQSLLQLSKTEYSRACPRCAPAGAAAAAACRCEVDAFRGRHLLDFAPYQRSMQRFAGAYAGGVSLEFFKDGVQTMHANLECEETAHVERPCAQHVDRVRDRAMWNRLQYQCLAKARGEGKAEERGGSRLVEARMPEEGGLGSDPIARLAKVLMASELPAGEGEGGDKGKRASAAGLNRREKNRMAAKRSNLKRKKNNKNLRLMLMVMRQHIAELKDKETELRCEHMWLRERWHTEGLGPGASDGFVGEVGPDMTVMEPSQASGDLSLDSR